MDLTQDRTKIMLCTYKTYKFCIKEINEMDGSQITGGKWRFRKTTREIIIKVLEIDEFESDVIYDITL